MSRKLTKAKTSIFQYSDFRHYLKDRLAELKSLRRGFTARDIAHKAGFGSPSFLKMILDGKRSLTQQTETKLCDVLEIHDKERDYFTKLTAFNQETDPNAKHELLIELENLRPRVACSKLQNNQHKYLSHDYYTCIREMVLLKNFKEDAKWIAAKCLPRISPAEAREALETLMELELLKRDEKTGKLIQAQSIVNTGPVVASIEAYGFHEAMLTKARKCLSLLPHEERNFSALTVPIPKELEAEIVKRIQVMQNDILTLVNQQTLSYDNVYQLNVQFFPVTNTHKTEETHENDNP